MKKHGFKVGDTVRVRTDIGQYENGQTPTGMYVWDGMVELAGTVTKIDELFCEFPSLRVRLKNDVCRYYYDQYCIEPFCPSVKFR